MVVTLDIVIFAILSTLGILFSLLVFEFRDMLHAAVSLALLFLVNSLFFLLLGQPLLAIVQLFIMVGGITTFLFVGVASAQLGKFTRSKRLWFGILWIIIFAVLLYPLNAMQFYQPQSQASFGIINITNSLENSHIFFYMILALMFAVSLGAIVLLRKAGAKK